MHFDNTPATPRPSSKLDEVLARLKAKPAGVGKWMACCPVHADTTPSLSIRKKPDGKILLNCFAECPTEAIVSALGLEMRDLFPESKPASSGPRIVAEYDYVDESGATLYQVVRLDPKSFRQRHKGPNGQWDWSMNGVRRVLYRLPDLLQSVKEGKPVVICEGEKDTDTVSKHGFVATCNVGGAGKWRDEYTPTFKGAAVAILAHKDPPGRQHANDVAQALRPVAASVKVIELPDVKGKATNDATDFFNNGGTADELRTLIEKMPTFGNDDPWVQLIEDGSDIMAMDIPPLVEIIEGLIVELTKLVIGSGSKSFKTWITIAIAICVAHGLDFWSRKTTRRRVLYVNLELRPQAFQRRLQSVANALAVTVDRNWLHHLPLRGKLAGVPVYEAVSRIIRVAKYLDAQVVVIDPLYKLNTEGDENSSRDQTVFFNQLDRITTEAACTLILNDHFSKGNQSEKDPLDAIRGSSAKGGDVDAAMILRRHDTDGCFSVDVIHRELPPVPAFVIGWEFPLMQLREDLDPADMRKPGGRPKKHSDHKLLSAIADTTRDDPIAVVSWASRLGIPRQTLTDYLPDLRKRRCIATVGEGNTARQYIAEEGRKILEQAQA